MEIYQYSDNRYISYRAKELPIQIPLVRVAPEQFSVRILG